MSVVGFDIGTSNCRVSCWWGTPRPEIIYEIPTKISITENQEILVGKEANGEKYPKTTISLTASTTAVFGFFFQFSFSDIFTIFR